MWKPIRASVQAAGIKKKKIGYICCICWAQVRVKQRGGGPQSLWLLYKVFKNALGSMETQTWIDGASESTALRVCLVSLIRFRRKVGWWVNMTASILHETEHPTVSFFNVCKRSGSNPLNTLTWKHFFSWIKLLHWELEHRVSKAKKKKKKL